MEAKLIDIEGAMKELVAEVKKELNLNVVIDGDLCPGDIIKSEVLVAITARLSGKLGINIPLSCYPFFNKQKHKQLSIRQAAKKVFNLAKDGK
jgi:hypothetical protein